MNWLDRIEQNDPVVQSADPIWNAAEYMMGSQDYLNLLIMEPYFWMKSRSSPYIFRQNF
ncbi:hypothetical protein [Peribacillus frigoritolerans]